MSHLNETPIVGRQAVVIGASIAGLVTARVLVNHFDRVLLIERDRFPTGDEPRKGLPQGQHVHILLAHGRQQLEKLFPGVQDELAAVGAPLVSYTNDVAQLGPVGWFARAESKLTSRASTRALLEARIRARVLADPSIQIREGCDVVGLLGGAAGQVTGIRIRERRAVEGKPAGEEAVQADLVVDASGRTSAAVSWLQKLGYPAPAETVINSYLGYASATFEPPAGFQASWKGMYLQPAPPVDKRGGVIWPVEGGRWGVTLIGMGRDYPPTDEDAFMAFAQSLRTPLFYQAIQQARRLSPIVGFRATENRLRHYERMTSFPDGFVVLGDAACAFNPVYGQGMTVATMSAQVLDACLGEQRRRRPDGSLIGMSRRFQQQLARSNATAWMLATGPDLRAPDTEGPRPSWVNRLMYRYLDRIFVQATRDPQVVSMLFEVLHLSTPPAALFHPRMVAALLRGTPKAAAQPAPLLQD
jgi:2-polyprenyl-6-methoxyphenol hydroxylase-like FAD-dependent oxidoreductase